MQAGQSAVFDIMNGHHFLSALTLAVYRGKKIISSNTVIIYSCVLYFVGVVGYSFDRKSTRKAELEKTKYAQSGWRQIYI